MTPTKTPASNCLYARLFPPSFNCSLSIVDCLSNLSKPFVVWSAFSPFPIVSFRFERDSLDSDNNVKRKRKKGKGKRKRKRKRRPDHPTQRSQTERTNQKKVNSTKPDPINRFRSERRNQHRQVKDQHNTQPIHNSIRFNFD